MRYVAAYLLAVLGGNEKPSAKDIKTILSSVGVDADDGCIKKVLDELAGKKLEDIISKGKEKLASMPVSGGAAVAAPAAASAPAAKGAPEKKEEKKKEESSDEASGDDDMGFGLFD